MRHLLVVNNHREFCGFLLGYRTTGDVFVTEVIVVHNSSLRDDGFAISEASRGRTRFWATTRGLEMIAVVHSHPKGSRELSPADEYGLSISDLPWVLVVADDCLEDGVLFLVFEPERQSRLLDKVQRAAIA